MDKTSAGMIGAAILIMTVSYFVVNFENDKATDERFLCKGTSRCFSGSVEEIIDGDTLIVDGETVRMSLVNTPEKEEEGYDDAIEILEKKCSIGSKVIVDEDDKQTGRSHRRILGVIYCSDRNDRMVNLNSELLRTGSAEIIADYCEHSEFAKEEWAISYGCLNE
jgi:endonuclease YncB( thermonuclease family)